MLIFLYDLQTVHLFGWRSYDIVINLLKPRGYCMYHQFWLHKIILSSCSVLICFIWISEKDSEFYPIQVSVIGFYNREGKCLLHGTNWIFKWNGLRLVLKGSSNIVLVRNLDTSFELEWPLIKPRFLICWNAIQLNTLWTVPRELHYIGHKQSHYRPGVAQRVPGS